MVWIRFGIITSLVLLSVLAYDQNCTPVEPPNFYPIRDVTDGDIIACTNKYKNYRRSVARAPNTLSYRLGDCIKALTGCEGEKFGVSTLAGEYEARANGVKGNMTLVRELLKERDGCRGFNKVRKDALVIHLRLGDVIERTTEPVEHLLRLGGNPAHTCSFQTAIKSVYEYLHDAETIQDNISMIEIISGWHFGSHEKGAIYEKCTAEMLRKAGYIVRVRKGSTLSHPDQDFYRMASAKYFIVGVGGFSRIVAKLVRLSGGKVVGRTF